MINVDCQKRQSIYINAYKNKFDMALLISGDSDLVPPIKEVHANFNNKRVILAFPPKRHNASMSLVSKGSFIICRKKLVDSQFDEEVISKNGFILRKPSNWK